MLMVQMLEAKCLLFFGRFELNACCHMISSTEFFYLYKSGKIIKFNLIPSLKKELSDVKFICFHHERG